MKNNNRTANSLTVIQGGKTDEPMSMLVLTRKDIKEFFATFAEAIMVDQKRVTRLPKEQLSPDYNSGMWRRNREDHIEALVKLYVTVDKMPKLLLKELSAFASVNKPETVKQPFLDAISDLATGVSSPWLYETATLFFEELMKEVIRQNPKPHCGNNLKGMITRWFDYDDPLRIAEDSECDYVDILASYIARESSKTKQALAKRSRSAFTERLFLQRNFEKIMRARGIDLGDVGSSK